MGASSPKPTPFILGLTGRIACGKTTVGDILLRLGALARIDADEIVHELMAPDTHVTARIGAKFGPGILNEDGSVNRGRLGEIVFGEQAKLRQLESIVHPAVREAIRARVRDLRGQEGVVVIDAVRLLQSELSGMTNAIWVVTCPPDLELERLTLKRGLSERQARERIGAQPSFDDPLVTHVIQNDGSLEELEATVRTAYQEITIAS